MKCGVQMPDTKHKKNPVNIDLPTLNTCAVVVLTPLVLVLYKVACRVVATLLYRTCQKKYFTFVD